VRRRVVFISLLVFLIGLTIWITSIDKVGIFSTFSYSDILTDAWAHLGMVVWAVLIATAVGVPLGILVTRLPFTLRLPFGTADAEPVFTLRLPRFLSLLLYGIPEVIVTVVRLAPGTSVTLLGFAIPMPFGILVTVDLRKSAPLVVGAGNVGQSIPSLAVIAIMAPLLGFGFKSAIVALFIYGLLPILRNSYAGMKNVEPAVIEAARGMGMTRWQIARKIELPLARPVIMAGIRISTVVTVGTAELAVLVGGGGLGRITLTGVFAGQPLLILQGAAPTAALAITLGFILERIESWITPRGLKIKAETS
jgi:osmoprotectant transport system permease protein